MLEGAIREALKRSSSFLYNICCLLKNILSCVFVMCISVSLLVTHRYYITRALQLQNATTQCEIFLLQNVHEKRLKLTNVLEVHARSS